MKKVLIINGSPRGEGSNTLKITDAFVEGLKVDGEKQIEYIHVGECKIEHCKGCFACWNKTPGKCIIRDDMDNILAKLIAVDSIIWSFPLYYYGMPSKIKALLDRNLPLDLPFIEERADGGCMHPARYERKGQNILISSCGFYSTENNYEALLKQFEIMFGKNYPRILCTEGELFSYEELSKRTDEYLSYVKQAGVEYARESRFSDVTQKKISELLYSPQVYVKMANASWGIADDSNDSEKMSEAEKFTRQMAALYNPSSFDGKKRVLEMYYTDVDETYQLTLDQDGCTVVKDDSISSYTARVETPLVVWQDIARNVYDAQQALMDGKYRILGDLQFMIAWDNYFGAGAGEDVVEAKTDKKTNMSLTIIPWVVIWVLLPIHPLAGGIAGIMAASLLHFTNLRWQLTVYDYITGAAVAAFGIAALLGGEMRFVLSLSYLFFGLLWLGSCFTGVPLSAHYSKNDYQGDIALRNPIFMKTNLILSICWGVLYLLTAIWTYVMATSLGSLTGLVNAVCPALLGAFTVFFQKWYPARVAGGKNR